LGEIEADGDSLGGKAAGALTSKHNEMRAPAQGLDIDTGDMKSSHGAYSQVGFLNILSSVFDNICVSAKYSE
jgi:hypothetical protein